MNNINSKELKLMLNKEIFSKKAILKTLYWYSADFTFEITPDNNFIILELKPIEEKSLEDMQNIFQKLNQDLIDFQIRQEILSETQNIRDLIIAKAFSNGNLDELPKGDISDPVQFYSKKND